MCVRVLYILPQRLTFCTTAKNSANAMKHGFETLIISSNPTRSFDRFQRFNKIILLDVQKIRLSLVLGPMQAGGG